MDKDELRNYGSDEGYGFGDGYDNNFNQAFNSADYNTANSYYADTENAYTYDSYDSAMGLSEIATSTVVARSFLFMFVGLLITAFTSLTVNPMTAFKMLSGYSFLVLLMVELVIVFISNWALSKNNALLAGILYTAYCYINGMTLSIIFLAYQLPSILTIFGITAAMFGVMALFGLVTKKDLTSVGSIGLMALVGIIIASTVNLIFLRSSILDMITCIVGVIIFVGLTAYDVQKIKERIAYSTEETVNSLALYGAFQIYLDFINIFLKLLRLFGKRK